MTMRRFVMLRTGKGRGVLVETMKDEPEMGWRQVGARKGRGFYNRLETKSAKPQAARQSHRRRGFGFLDCGVMRFGGEAGVLQGGFQRVGPASLGVVELALGGAAGLGFGLVEGEIVAEFEDGVAVGF